MPLSTITARVDKNDKVAFDQFCSSVGLNSSSAINLYIKAVLRERRIPFDIVSPQGTPQEKLADAFTSLRSYTQNSDSADMSLDEINEEIRASRQERRPVQ